MRTIALRFSESFSPSCGTISAHQNIIDSLGYVWYGKLGLPLSNNNIETMLHQTDPKFLLINREVTECYWVHFDSISTKMPLPDEYPSYYGNKVVRMETWFRVVLFEPVPIEIISHCVIVSSGKSLNESFRKSLNPCFIIEYKEDE